MSRFVFLGEVFNFNRM